MTFHGQTVSANFIDVLNMCFTSNKLSADLKQIHPVLQSNGIKRREKKEVGAQPGQARGQHPRPKTKKIRT